MSDDKSWIYFLVMVVLSIIGSINKSKKKNVTPPSSPPREEEDDFPTIFFPGNVPPEVVKPVEPVKKVPFSIDRVDNVEGLSAMSPSLEMPQKGLNPEEESNRPVVDFVDKDELKKAVIYSEIFNRKYF
ncbi:MAG: hypothetical protein Q8909_11720 [Bacteroidota bacterium]|nr:hypothetical protein [Bacteroidota bacterium]